MLEYVFIKNCRDKGLQRFTVPCISMRARFIEFDSNIEGILYPDGSRGFDFPLPKRLVYKTLCVKIEMVNGITLSE